MSFSMWLDRLRNGARFRFFQLGLFFGVLGLIPCTSLPALAQSQVAHNLQVSRLTSDSTLRKGGSGGSLYNLSCSEGQVLVGVNARAGLVVDNVQGVCTSVTSTGAWTGSTSTTGSAGGPGGSSQNRRCPSGFALSGFSGRAGGVVDRIVLECTRLASNGSFNTSSRQNLSAIGGSGGTAFSTTRCTRPARSIAGKSGIVLDSFELACESAAPLITRTAIDAGLNGAGAILQADAGANDVACNVDLNRSGRVRIEPSNGLFNVNSSSDMDAACNLLGFAVVTNQITWCSGVGSSIIGCARPGCMVVVPFGTGTNQNQLWAHEFGHTRALPHRSGNANIMNPVISGGTGVNQGECDNYRNPVISFFFSFLPAEEATGKLSVQEFVSQAFVHGVPYEQAAAYGPAAVPELIAILRDPKQESSWSNAATMLAMINDPSGVGAVLEFVKAPRAGATAQAAWARSNAVLSLGYAANRGNAQALEYLKQSLEPGVWQKRGTPGVQAKVSARGDDAESDDEDEIEELLTESAVQGLALSGKPEAKLALEARAKAPGASPRQVAVLASALSEYSKIAGEGLKSYDGDRRARAAERAEAAKRGAARATKLQTRGDGETDAADSEAQDAPPPPDDADETAAGSGE